MSELSTPLATGPLVLSIDQGTSATKAVLVDGQGAVRDRVSVPIALCHPQSGWAEQDALEIWKSVQTAVQTVMAEVEPSQVVAVGLSTQRESILAWERESGLPLGPMLGWQDSRGGALCAELRSAGHADRVRQLTGLPLDAMFSASKAAALLDLYDADRSRSSRGEVLLGTIDSWLMWKIGGRHLIEAGNAARTQLLDITSRTWDPYLLDLFSVPVEALPTVVASTGPFIACHDLSPLDSSVSVTGVLGDSHAALFAHAGWKPGQVKVTYGTGSSVMGVATTQSDPVPGVARTIAWETDTPTYALEGNIRSSGATLTWLAQLLSSTPGQVAALAAPSSEGVVLVPAFTGLGAPWWDDQARASITGISAGTRAAHIARAGLDAIAFQIEDVIAAFDDSGETIATILADGGPSSNLILMQLQADTSGRQVSVSRFAELSALGAAHIAGLGAGLWTLADLESLPRPRTPYDPASEPTTRADRQRGWHAAVSAALGTAHLSETL